MWFVEAEFLVCTSICLKLQLSLSKQVLYQMVTCNCFGLSLLYCPFLRAGQQNFHSLFFFFFLEVFKDQILSIVLVANGYTVQRVVVVVGFFCCCFVFCHFMAWISSGFLEVSLELPMFLVHVTLRAT